MDEITFLPLTLENFGPSALDGFIRRQSVKECWRRVEGVLVLRPVEYIEDWTLEERREMAYRVRNTLQAGGTAYGVLCGGEIVGFAAVAGERLGSRKQYADLSLFYVSEPFRGRGFGRTLFYMACEAAREMKAEKLYISAHSAREVIAVYRALGCVEVEEIDPHHAAAEPCDLQMEYHLNSGGNVLEQLYHGSATPGIRSLEARSVLHGTNQRIVYFTDNIPYALFYIWEEQHTGYAGKHVTGWVQNGVAHYEEQFPHQLERFYQGVSGGLYRTPKGPHMQAVSGREGLFYSPDDTLVEAEYVPDVYEALLRYEAEGNLKVLRYLEQSEARQDELVGLIAEVISRAGFYPNDQAQQRFMKTYFSQAWERARAQQTTEI